MFPASTKGNGVHTTASPLDVCKVPAPPSPIPIPYANMVDGLAESGDEAAIRTQKKIVDDAARKGIKTKTATGAAIASQGNEAGVQKGIASNKNAGKTYFKTGSSKVKVEGKGVSYLGDMTSHNGANAPAGTQIAPSQSKVILMGSDPD